MSAEIFIGLIGLFGGLITGMVELRRISLNTEREQKVRETELALEREKQAAENERLLRGQIDSSMKMMHQQNQDAMAEMRRLNRANEQLALDNSRNLELRAEAEMKATMLEGQITTLTGQLDKARQELMDTAQKVGQFQSLQTRQEQLETTLRKVEKMFSEASEQNRALKQENSQLLSDKTLLIEERDQLLKKLFAMEDDARQLRDQISELTKRIGQLENEKAFSQKGLEHAQHETIVAVGAAIGDIPVGGSASGIGGSGDTGSVYGGDVGNNGYSHYPVRLGGDRRVSLQAPAVTMGFES